MLDYISLSAVAAVAREGSFEKAAASLGVTPSAVSQRIKGLEDRLGAILLVRGSPCRPTDIGARLCAHVERVRLLESDVAQTLPGLVSPSQGPATIRIAVNADSLGTWFPRAAASFVSETGALLDLVLDDEGHTAERLQSGDVLAAVTADPEPVTGCRIHPLGQMTYVAAASPAYVASHFAETVDTSFLNVAPMLRFDRRDTLQLRWTDLAHGAAISPPVHWVPSTQGMLDMTLAGLGWSMVPIQLGQPFIEQGRLVELPPGKRLCVPLYWQRTRLAARLLDRLTDAVRTASRTELEAAAG
jgi:LysR family transcriptional regulator (chromosome initiation inhibitor)